MKRILPLMLILPLGVYATTACTKSHGDTNQSADGTNPGGPGGGDNEGPKSPSDVNPDELKKNPIEGIAPAKVVVEAGEYTDGPVWDAKLGVVFFTTPLGEGALYRMLPDGRVMKVRDGSKTQGTTPIGTTLTTKGELIVAEAKRLTRTGFDAKNNALPPEVIASGYPANGAPAPQQPTAADGGAAPPPTSVPGQFDTLKDVTARKDGTLYVTDPGYFSMPEANRIYRIDPGGHVQVVEAFEDVPRPTGIAISPDEKYLYVGFSLPLQGTMPFIRQYIVNDDGTLGEWTKFVEIGPQDSAPDGLACDLAGNLYVATKAGIEVYKNDSSKIGVIPIPEKPTGMTFGDKDMKSLYVTTEGVKIWQLRINVPGMAQ